MFKSQLKYRIKSLILVLTNTNISVIIMTEIKKGQPQRLKGGNDENNKH